MSVDFPVLEGLPDVLGVELIGKCASILVQSSVNLFSFGLGYEFGGVWVVVESPECPEGYDERDDALEYEDPCPSTFTAYAIHL